MTARTLTSLAHALGAATDLDAALVALAGGLAESDREASVALLGYDHRTDKEERVMNERAASLRKEAGRSGRVRAA